MENKLNMILEHAINNTRFYSSCVKKPLLSEFPILTKNDLRSNVYDILDIRYNSGNIHNLYSTITSGSTGFSTKVYWNKDDYLQSNTNIWRLRKKHYNISPSDKLLVFTSFFYNGNIVKKPKRIHYSENNTILNLSKFHLDDESILQYFNIIEQFLPKWMSVQISTLERIMEIMSKYGVNPFRKLEYIELNGEMVTSAKCERVRKFFNVAVANMYGAMEVGAIAYECPYHSMHVIDENVYLEVLPDEESQNKKRAIVTSLTNRAMPIIRYDLGDYIDLCDTSLCPCGCNTSIISKIYGRSTDKMQTAAGAYLSPYVIMMIIEQVSETMHNSIVKFKLKQEKVGEVIVLLVLDAEFQNWAAAIIEELNAKLYNEETLSGISFIINIVDNIYDSNISKFKVFESLI